MRRAIEAALAVLIAAIALPAATVESVAMPGGPTAEEVARYNQNIADATWAALPVSPGVERPAITLGESIAEDEWPAAFGACLGDIGFTGGGVLSGGDGAFIPMGAGQMDDVALLAFYRCVVTHPREFTSRGFYSAAQIDYLYRYYDRWLVPCLLMHGYRIYEVPTHDEFVTSRGAWTPFATPMADLGGHPVQSEESLALVSNRCGKFQPDAMLR